MVAAVVLFMAGFPYYEIKKPQGSILTEVFGGIWVSSTNVYFLEVFKKN